MTDGIAIRVARAEDVPQLAALIARSARGLSRGFYSEEETERAIAKVYGVDSQLIADGTMFIAEVDGALAGCGGWSRRRTLYGGDQFRDRSDDALDPAVDAARIRAFFVDPAFARRGVGRALLQACEDAARANGFKRAEMMATMPGVPLYAAYGYESGDPVDVDLGEGYILRCVKMARSLDRHAYGREDTLR